MPKDEDLEEVAYKGGFVDEETTQAAVYEVLQTNPPEDTEGDVLVSYFTICEWMDPDGAKYVTRLDSGLMPWQREGLLRYVLRWESEDEQEEPD